MKSFNRDHFIKEWKKREEENTYKARDIFAADNNPKNIYPEIRLTEPFGRHLPYTPLHFLTPFMWTQIVAITPSKTETDFKERYGVTLDELIGLIKDGRVVPLLYDNPSIYPAWFDKLFFEIEEKEQFHIPNYLRAHNVILDQQDLLEIESNIKNKYIRSDLNQEWTDFFKTFSTESKQTAIFGITRTVTQLRMLNLKPIAQEIQDMPDLNKAINAAYICSYLTDPLFYSLGGYTHITRETVHKLHEIMDIKIERHSNKFLKSSRAMFAELDKLVLKYGHPDNCPVNEFVSKTQDIGEVKENMQILQEVERKLNELNITNAYDEANKIREIVAKIEIEARDKLEKHYRFSQFSMRFGFPILSSTAATYLSNNLQMLSPLLSFPLFLMTSAAIAEVVKDDLNNIARRLVGVRHQYNMAPFIIWKRRGD